MSPENPETDVACGCGPTADEQRTLRSPLTRRTALGVGIASIVGLAGSGLAFGSPAFATLPGYPSWDDVQRAKANEASAAAEVSRIEGLIQQLQNDLAAKQALAEKLGAEYQVAQEKYEEAVTEADSLQAQADDEAAKAQDAASKLGRLAAQQYRSGGDDTSLELFFSGSAATADELLAKLGTMDQLLAANRGVYADAVGARDNARSLSDKAAVARDARDKLKHEAERKMVAAQDAATAAQAALAAQNDNLGTLQAQLAALKDTTAKTVTDYQAGVEEERRQREERERRAREEAARRAAEAERQRQAAAAAEAERQRQAAAAAAAAAAASQGSHSGGSAPAASVPPPSAPAPSAPAPSGGGGVAGSILPSGWVRPAAGYISAWFGTRGGLCANGYCTSSGHRGIDFATSCWSPVYAVAPGRVVFAALSGAWGNYIKVDHGGGIISGYAHLPNGGYNVSVGDRVSAGQMIAYVGNTGASTGCHLHFEIYSGGVRIDPAPFLRARGISV